MPYSPVFHRTYVRPARGTTRLCKLLIFKHFTKTCFLYPQNLVAFGHFFFLAEEPGDRKTGIYLRPFSCEKSHLRRFEVNALSHASR
jgi:hypothetical protein